MFSSLLRSLPQLGRRWKPLNFSNPNFVRLADWPKVEEETLPDYIASQYYPTRIGEVINQRYQVIDRDQYHLVFIQPQIYRAPEVILGVPWTFSADIWNVGCMIWDIYEGGSLFTGQDPEFQRYRSRAHLAEMINLLGPPPPSLVIQGELSDKFFSSDFLNQDLLTGLVPLEQRETTLEGTAEREAFLRFMRKMLQWEPGKRSSAKELAEDEWIHRHM
ncbi:hypothetical protein ARAM_003161 [Aspergillus rambellii]|uniref:Protein kinase domain-containing protein n=1 Tax=Aspergillus rambellii TaxID=308745 RepID=A0A0F8XQV2_9EURO|nr:hypothetical protein ARAM_003161 [Aspergillus rambellii]